MTKLYHIFITSIIKTIKAVKPQIQNKRSVFYTNKQELKQWSKNFRIFVNEFYTDILKQELQKMYLTKIEDTTLYGIYQNNYFETLEISLITENKDIEKQAQIISPLLGTNEVSKSFKELFFNAENLTKSQVKELWDVFTDAFFETINKNIIPIFNNHFNFKEGVIYAINDGYLKITKNSYEVLSLKDNVEVKTIFKLPINANEIKTWEQLSIFNKEDNYSIFKEFINNKVKNYLALSCVVADLLQPLINTEILPIMVGSGGTGKSTLQAFLTEMLGANIVGNINLVSALNNTFERNVLYTHPIVFTSELESSSFKEQATLKQMISREKTQLNNKHQAVKVARPIAKMLVASNSILKTTDSDGLNRRVCFVSFNNKKIREDLTLNEFNKTFNQDTTGFVAFLILGAQTLLQHGWDYKTFNILSDIELQKEFEGQYNSLNSFLTELIESKFLINSNHLSMSSLADLLILLNQSQSDYDNDNLMNIIESVNLKQDTKRALLNRMRGAGLAKLETTINNRYKFENKIEVIKLENERNAFISNSGYRYQQSIMINNLSFDFNNEELINFLSSTTISADRLDNIIPNFKESIALTSKCYYNGDEKPLKDIKVRLIDLFAINAPKCLSINAERILEFNSPFWEKKEEQNNVLNPSSKIQL